jgi:hypothetical protein
MNEKKDKADQNEDSVDKIKDWKNTGSSKWKKNTIVKIIINRIIKLLKTLLIKVFWVKVLAISAFLLAFIIAVIVVVFIPILILITVLKSPGALLDMWITAVVHIVKDEFGNITGFTVTDLPGVKITWISGYQYVIDWKDSDQKSQILKGIGNMLFKETSWIKSTLWLDNLFGTYQQSLWSKALDVLLFFKENKDKNFEDAKKALETIYKLKYNRRQSDYFIFDYIENKGKYATNFKPELENEIISKLKLTNNITSFDSLKKQRYEWLGYYVPASKSWSWKQSNLITLTSKEQASTATGWSIIDYSVSWMEYNTAKTIEFFYLKSSIKDYLSVYWQDLTDYSNNDLKALWRIEGDVSITNKTLDEQKVSDLKNMLNIAENEFINSVYEANKSKIVLKWNTTITDDIGKLIIKRVIEKKYNTYDKIIFEWLVFNLSLLWKVSEKWIDYASCKINQLYWPSNASDKYPGGLHNWYDISFVNKQGTKSVQLRAMLEWTVVISKEDPIEWNQVVIKSSIPWKSAEGKDIWTYIEYLHLQDWSRLPVWNKVTIWEIIWIQGDTWNSQWAHLHISIFPSWVKSWCEWDNLNSSHWYACAVPPSQFFKIYWYENIFQQMWCINTVGNNWIWNIW